LKSVRKEKTKMLGFMHHIKGRRKLMVGGTGLVLRMPEE